MDQETWHSGHALDVEVVGAGGRAAGVGVHAGLVARLVEVRLVHQDQRLDGHQHLRAHARKIMSCLHNLRLHCRGFPDAQVFS